MSKSVLIVDDSTEVRKALRSLLQDGMRVCGEAVDGLDAVEKANALKPNVVILDLSMPRMNGLEAARAIRPSLPEDSAIVLFTVYADRIAASAAAEAGVDVVIAKSNFQKLLEFLGIESSATGRMGLPA